MGKVTVIIESKQMQTQALYEAVKDLFPTEEEFRSGLLNFYGFVPAEVKIFIVPSDEE